MLRYGFFCPFSPLPVTSLLALSSVAHVSPVGLPPARYRAARQHQPYHSLLQKGPEGSVVIPKSSRSLQLPQSCALSAAQRLQRKDPGLTELLPFPIPLFAVHSRLAVTVFALKLNKPKHFTHILLPRYSVFKNIHDSFPPDDF